MTDEGQPETLSEFVEEKVVEPMKAAMVSVTARKILAGPVSVAFELPEGIDTPIGVYIDDLARENYVTLCAITFTRGKHSITVPAGFIFDGASIPRMFWGVKGFSPVGAKLWAALIHDWLCDEAARYALEVAAIKPQLDACKTMSGRAELLAMIPDALPLTIGDAIFVQVLLDTGVETTKSVFMYLCVRAHHTWPRASAWAGSVTRGGVYSAVGSLAAAGAYLIVPMLVKEFLKFL